MNNYSTVFCGEVFAKDHKPFLYEVGQKVRVSNRILSSFQIPAHWAGCVVQILSRRHIYSQTKHIHVYKVKMLHGSNVFEFFEEDFDRRFVRKNLDKQLN